MKSLIQIVLSPYKSLPNSHDVRVVKCQTQQPPNQLNGTESLLAFDKLLDNHFYDIFLFKICKIVTVLRRLIVDSVIHTI